MTPRPLPYIPAVALACLLLLATSCDDDAGTTGADTATSDTSVSAPDAGDVPELDAGEIVEPEPGPDLTEAVFAPEHVLEIAIELAPSDWDSLRAQTRTLFDVLGPGCLDDPPDEVFTYFPATVTIDGTRVEQVGLRKKGFLGSLSTTKPSLKLSFDAYVADQRYESMERMTLNNSRQDPSFVHQCLGYAVFATAGVPAPRCNYAHVTVNGDDLGVFVHVEAVKKAFLRRHFDDDEGKLYEGTLSDFRDGWMATFEKKTNKLDPDNQVELDGIKAAAEAPDEALLDALGAAVDLDAFFTFWAAEVLVGHWDGYAGNTNNFFVYFDPTDRQRGHFMPWGIDGVFTNVRSPAMVTGVVARRLLVHPEGNARYTARMQALLQDVWNEEQLNAEVDRMEALLAPYVRADVDADWGVGLQVVRQFIRDRRRMVEEELLAPPPSADDPLREAPCAAPMGTLTLSFSTTWGTLPIDDLFTTGTGTFELTVDGQTPTIVRVGAKAGLGTEGEQTGRAVLNVAGLNDTTIVFLSALELWPDHIAPGTVDIDWSDTKAYLVTVDLANGQFNLLGLLGDGVLTFTEAGTDDGAPLVGTLTATVYRLGG